MISPLDITFAEIVLSPEIARKNPLSKKRDINGKILLWEGYEKAHDCKTPLYRLYEDAQGNFKYYRFNKQTNAWISVPKFEVKKPYFRRTAKPPKGRVLIELFANGRMTRTVGE